jgi:acetolactate synthase I/II/III large subunit
MYTASSALLETLRDAGVSYIFANFGSDHPALIEAIAAARAERRPIPDVITCPNEMVALSAAQGFAQVTGQAQAVVVHVECGTQSLAGAVHNAAKARVPVFIFAGTSPFTQEGELKGSRNEFIQWVQDVPDQRGIVRQYMKYDNELRSARNLPQIVLRAFQLAHSDPRGPVYVVGAREVMEEAVAPAARDLRRWSPLGPTALPAAAVAEIAGRLGRARRPLIVTSYLGRQPAAVPELARLCRRLGIGVLESVPSYVNFPHDDELYQGNQWNEPGQNPALAEADVVLVLDSDVPWIPTVSRPAESAVIYHIDVDPLKPSTPLWYIGAEHSFQADAATALRQLNAHLDGVAPDPVAVAERGRHCAERHRRRAEALTAREAPDAHVITPEYLIACLRRALGEDWIVLNEGITNYSAVCDHMARSRPGSMIASGGGSLGWSGGAAIGVKLARPGANVAVLAGDGCYMFSQPSTVHWMARRYKTPFLQVVFNNRGWRAPKFSTLAVHPDGYASRAADIDVGFDPPPDYAGIAAAAGGAFGRILKQPEEVEAGIAEALKVLREEGRAAVLDCWLAPL